jgi:hypothetical protein
MLLSEVRRVEPASVINMPGHAIAVKKGQTREKAVGFQEMGTLRCDSCGEEFFIVHAPPRTRCWQRCKRSGSRRYLLRSMSATRNILIESNCRASRGSIVSIILQEASPCVYT